MDVNIKDLPGENNMLGENEKGININKDVYGEAQRAPKPINPQIPQLGEQKLKTPATSVDRSKDGEVSLNFHPGSQMMPSDVDNSNYVLDKAQGGYNNSKTDDSVDVNVHIAKVNAARRTASYILKRVNEASVRRLPAAKEARQKARETKEKLDVMYAVLDKDRSEKTNKQRGEPMATPLVDKDTAKKLMTGGAVVIGGLALAEVGSAIAQNQGQPAVLPNENSFTIDPKGLAAAAAAVKEIQGKKAEGGGSKTSALPKKDIIPGPLPGPIYPEGVERTQAALWDLANIKKAILSKGQQLPKDFRRLIGRDGRSPEHTDVKLLLTGVLAVDLNSDKIEPTSYNIQDSKLDNIRDGIQSAVDRTQFLIDHTKDKDPRLGKITQITAYVAGKVVKEQDKSISTPVAKTSEELRMWITAEGFGFFDDGKGSWKSDNVDMLTVAGLYKDGVVDPIVDRLQTYLNKNGDGVILIDPVTKKIYAEAKRGDEASVLKWEKVEGTGNVELGGSVAKYVEIISNWNWQKEIDANPNFAYQIPQLNTAVIPTANFVSYVGGRLSQLQKQEQQNGNFPADKSVSMDEIRTLKGSDKKIAEIKSSFLSAVKPSSKKITLYNAQTKQIEDMKSSYNGKDIPFTVIRLGTAQDREAFENQLVDGNGNTLKSGLVEDVFPNFTVLKMIDVNGVPTAIIFTNGIYASGEISEAIMTALADLHANYPAKKDYFKFTDTMDKKLMVSTSSPGKTTARLSPIFINSAQLQFLAAEGYSPVE